MSPAKAGKARPRTQRPGGIHRIGRIIGSRRRLFAGAALGLLVGILSPHSFSDTTRAILGWDTAVTVYLVLSAVLFVNATADRMEQDAEAQEEGEWTIFILTLTGVIFSFVALLQEFSGIKDMPPGQRSLHVILVALTLFLSWMMTHMTFAFRYAHEYYAKDNGGPGVDEGLEFPSDERPDYFDFVYFSLVLGMTFQVSDVQIRARKFRRMATIHGLLGFLFNTIILALTVNIAASLL